MTEGKTRRRLLLGGAVGALLVVLYAAAGYWLAPRYVLEALAEAAERNGLTLGVTTVRTHPFALAVELEELKLYDADGRTFAQAKSAAADLAWASFWSRGWIVQKLRVDAPEVALGSLPGARAADAGNPVAITIQNLVVENGTLRYAPRDLALEALTLHARDLSTLDAAAGTYEAAAQLAGGGQLASRGAVTAVPFAAEGTLSVAALRAAQLLPDAQGQLQGSARFVFAGSRLELREVSISGEGLAYAGIELPRATLSAQKVPLPPSQPFEAAAQASLAPQGTLAAQGRVRFAPLELHLDLSAEDLPLAEAQRWLPPGMALRLVSGAVSGSGRLDVSQGAVSYDGSARVGGLRIEARDSGALLLAWKEAETAKLRFDSSPLTIAAGEIALRAPEGRLVIEQGGAVNFAEAFGGAGRDNATRDDDPGARVSVERLRVEAGTLHFADRSLDTPFEATIGELSGAVAGFSTAANAPAQVRLNGRVQPYGVARIRGTINLNAPTTLADITAVFRNLQLEAFNPYVAKFAGYRIESGRLAAELRYEVREGRLVGSNQLTFRNMQLGEKLEEKGLLDVPLELAVALLADSQGRIDLAVPVRGNLSDPQFDMGAIVARALGNVVKKIVSAPFRALARLFGGDDGPDLGAIDFAPGSAALSPPAEEKWRGWRRALPSARRPESTCTAAMMRRATARRCACAPRARTWPAPPASKGRSTCPTRRCCGRRRRFISNAPASALRSRHCARAKRAMAGPCSSASPPRFRSRTTRRRRWRARARRRCAPRCSSMAWMRRAWALPNRARCPGKPRSRPRFRSSPRTRSRRPAPPRPRAARLRGTSPRTCARFSAG